MDSAVLLIAHGSRLATANDELRKLADMLRERLPGEIIEHAYLELSEPTIPQGLLTCVERGARQIKMLPYFLSPGSHVTHDLERFREQFGHQHQTVNVTLCPPIGLHPRVIDILLERLTQGAE